MVDIFALALSHGLLALVAIRLLSRPELDREGAAPKRSAKRAMRVRSENEGPAGNA
ncbi:hypothetical protein GCM10011494_04790 [Novosphingobium endophyticum]|uniref:Uncharacterized protein n=1 Tax=Novosphingobium endophyticum TaxID=1955250 RepID=A0A916TQT8_9SPHN|nr:hypothetical protein GCM10011494_04790 [Novosphingobium endophyticum]